FQDIKNQFDNILGAAGLIKVGNGSERVFSRDGDDQPNGTDRLVIGATLQRVTAKEIEMCTSKFIRDRRRQMCPPMIMQGQNGGF
ncbi:MAG: hypothetical protein VYB45_01815, partial [Pseudomonadota bacterium]|nr:hypothetical protein [Pseudomonadota bacterium]